MSDKELKELIRMLRDEWEYSYAEAFYTLSQLPSMFEYEGDILEVLDLEDYPCTEKDLKILGIEP